MFDTHAIARSLTDAGIEQAQADAITDAVRQAAEQGDHVTGDQFKVGLAEMRAEQRAEIAEVRAEIAEVRTEVANLDTRLSTQIANLRTEIGEVKADLKSDLKVLRFALFTFGPLILALLVRLVFFPAVQGSS